MIDVLAGAECSNCCCSIMMLAVATVLTSLFMYWWLRHSVDLLSYDQLHDVTLVSAESFYAFCETDLVNPC